MVHATLQPNGISRNIVLIIDPAINPQLAATISREIAGVVEKHGYIGPAKNLRIFASHTAEYAQPTPVAQSGS